MSNSKASLKIEALTIELKNKDNIIKALMEALENLREHQELNKPAKETNEANLPHP